MIKFVELEKVSKIIENFNNKKPSEIGKFLTVEGNLYIAVDNSTGDAWTEDFPDMKDAIDWLNDKIEIGEYYQRMIDNA